MHTYSCKIEISFNRKWDWYDQTACLVAAAAQDAAEVGAHTQQDRRHLTRNPKYTISKKQKQPKSKQQATKNYETYTKGR